MIVLHYRAIPDLLRQVQRATAASVRATRWPPPTRRACAAAATRVGAGQAARPTRPRCVRRRAAACARTARPGPAVRWPPERSPQAS
jgi:hypothetical protein